MSTTPEESLLVMHQTWDRLVREALDNIYQAVGTTVPKPMTPAEHYNEAVRLLAMANDPDLPSGTTDRRGALRTEAQIHATLACVPRGVREARTAKAWRP